jgi:hypothetical protein
MNQRRVVMAWVLLLAATAGASSGRTVWVEQGDSPFRAAVLLNELGEGLSLSGDGQTLAMGAPDSDLNADDAGLARVYRRQGESWVQLGADFFGPQDEDSRFGAAVSLSEDGTIFAVGAPGANGTGTGPLQDDFGRVQVFQYTGGDWQQLGGYIYGMNTYDTAGAALELNADGTVLAVGFPHANLLGQYWFGQVRVFRYEHGDWIQMGSTINGQHVDEEFGSEVRLSADGQTLAVGVPHHDASTQEEWTGVVRVYRFQGGDWLPLGDPLAGSEAFGLFGDAVDLSHDGNLLAVGAPGHHPDITDGLVRVYAYTGQQWQQVGQDILGSQRLDHFGDSVSLSGDGSVVAAGAPGASTLFDGIWYSNGGRVEVYRYTDGSWLPLGYDVIGAQGDYWFGDLVSLSTDAGTLAVAAPATDTITTHRGVVHTFSSEERSPWGMFLPAILNARQGQN